MTLSTRLYTFFRGIRIGEDAFGNTYYTERRESNGSRRRRWVLYNGKAEPSKVPAEWHGWLHYTVDTPPPPMGARHYGWEKPHLPNLTGTAGAYLPPGHLLKGGHHAPTTAEYQAWVPE